MQIWLEEALLVARANLAMPLGQQRTEQRELLRVGASVFIRASRSLVL